MLRLLKYNIFGALGIFRFETIWFLLKIFDRHPLRTGLPPSHFRPEDWTLYITATGLFRNLYFGTTMGMCKGQI